MKSSLFVFLFTMWALIIVGGGIVIFLLGPIEISSFGDLNELITSIIQGMTAIALVVIWIFILSKIKNWIFRKEIKS